MMKLPALLFATALLSFATLSGSRVSGQEFGSGAYSPGPGGYSDRSEPFGGYGVPQNDTSRGFPEQVNPQIGAAEWISEHDLAPGGMSPASRYPVGSDGPYSPGPQGREMHHGGRYRQSGAPGGAEASSWWRPSLSEKLPSDGRRGYRFRGDDRGLGATRGDVSWGGGYRFRPLTDQERARMGGVWRPSDSASSGPERSRGSNGVPVEETYGYRPDGWFQRYYRGGP